MTGDLYIYIEPGKQNKDLEDEESEYFLTSDEQA